MAPLSKRDVERLMGAMPAEGAVADLPEGQLATAVTTLRDALTVALARVVDAPPGERSWPAVLAAAAEAADWPPEETEVLAAAEHPERLSVDGRRAALEALEDLAVALNEQRDLT